MAYRIPTAAEAEALANHLEAKGYPRAEAGRNYTIAFPEDDPDGCDGCLMFEGPSIGKAETWAREWSGLDKAGQDKHRSWLNAVTFCAMLTLAARAGYPGALHTRAEDLAYAKANWNK